jgi:hypothetical protein
MLVRGWGAREGSFRARSPYRQARTDRLGSAPDPCGQRATAWCDAITMMVAQNVPHRACRCGRKDGYNDDGAKTRLENLSVWRSGCPSNRTAAAFFVAPQNASAGSS